MFQIPVAAFPGWYFCRSQNVSLISWCFGVLMWQACGGCVCGASWDACLMLSVSSSARWDHAHALLLQAHWVKPFVWFICCCCCGNFTLTLMYLSDVELVKVAVQLFIFVSWHTVWELFNIAVVSPRLQWD